MKGALDFVKTAIACRRLGLDADFICHGQGKQVVAMREAVAAAGMSDRVLVGDSLPYPELVELTKSCDAFVACHVQADPSCSYLEAMGCGLPLFVYANRMARRICEEAHCGAVSPIGAHGLLARQIVEAFAVPERLASWARTARQYALDHCFEKEFAKRAAAIRRQYDLAR
jgi:glycosyltransferase involved in cell wall biosynthesis